MYAERQKERNHFVARNGRPLRRIVRTAVYKDIKLIELINEDEKNIYVQQVYSLKND